MFIAELIENKKYYKFRSKQLLVSLLAGALIGLLVNVPDTPVWLTILVIGLYVGVLVYSVCSQRQMRLSLGDKRIEMDVDEIRIKSKEGRDIENIQLNQVDKLILKDEYSLPQETVQEVGQELAGKTKQNYLILLRDGRERRLDFEIKTHYMLRQLNKLFESWKMKGYPIDRAN